MSTEHSADEEADAGLATELRTSAEADHVMRYDHGLMLQAADRIEALEKALERIAYYDDTLDRHTAKAMQNTARQALLTARAALPHP